MRDTDFFLSVDGKLGEDNLSNKEIIDIYNSNIGRDFAVICKSASAILKMVYDKLEIRSKLIETNTSLAGVYDDEEFLINHWFLVVYDDIHSNDAYFMTLTPDLSYIQMNMETKHFASNIPYTRHFGSKIMQVYKGPEIKPKFVSREELRKIDLEVGYIQKSYFYNDKYQKSAEWNYNYDNASFSILKEELKDNHLFYELTLRKTLFYQFLSKFQGEDNKEISFVDDDLSLLSSTDWNYFEKLVCLCVSYKIEEILGYNISAIPSLESKYWTYSPWLFNLCVQLNDEISRKMKLKSNEGTKVVIDVNYFDYRAWSKEIKKNYQFKREKNNILLILDQLNSLVNCIESKENIKNIRVLLKNLGYHFIPDDLIFENNIDQNGYLSSYYIAHKFNTLFPYIFSCNDYITDFNKMGYSEQNSIIKEILILMFPEITKDNSSMLVDYNENYNAIFNRIQLYTVRNKITKEYSIVFNIISNSQEDDYYFFYNPSRNLFRTFNFLDFYNDYIIVSNRMKNKMSIMDLEKIEKKR